MHQAAWDALEELPPERKTDEPVLVMRLAVLQAMERWEMGATIARGAIRLYPESPDLYLTGAYCIRRAECLEAAKLFLELGSDYLEGEALYWYNLGCYECQLGDLDRAGEYVGKACAMEAEYKRLALDDTDLEPLWERLSSSL